jgi:hypothetical protein
MKGLMYITPSVGLGAVRGAWQNGSMNHPCVRSQPPEGQQTQPAPLPGAAPSVQGDILPEPLRLRSITFFGMLRRAFSCSPVCTVRPEPVPPW